MVGQVLSQAWQKFASDLVAWLIFGAVFLLVGGVLPFLGAMFLLPMALRETKRAILEDRAPSLNGLFDLSSLGEDLSAIVLYAGAQTLGMLACCVGWPIAWLGFWFSPELAADKRVTAKDAMRLSWAYTTKNIGFTALIMFINCALLTLGSSVIIGVFFAMPLVLLICGYTWLHIRQEVYALAPSLGIQVAPEQH